MNDFLRDIRKGFAHFPYGTLLMIAGLTLVVLACLAFLASRATYFGALAPALVGGFLVALGALLDTDYPNPQLSSWLLGVAVVGFFLTFPGLAQAFQALGGGFVAHPLAMVLNALTNVVCTVAILVGLTRFVQHVHHRGYEKYGDALEHH